MRHLRKPLSTVAEARAHVHYKLAVHEMDDEVAQRMLAAMEPLAPDAPVDYGALLRRALCPDPPAIVYHSTYGDRRAAIEREGLEPRQPYEHNWAHLDATCAQPCAVYVAPSVHVALFWAPDLVGADVWSFPIEGLAWQHDALNPGCWAVTEHVPPERLTLTGVHPVDLTAVALR